MATPFPGMDPYLEHPDLWPDVHHGLIESLRDALAQRLRPKYRIAIEKRTYLAEGYGGPLDYQSSVKLDASKFGSRLEAFLN